MRPQESIRSKPGHRAGRAVEFDHHDVAGPQLTRVARAVARDPQCPLHRGGAGGAAEHQLADRQAAAGAAGIEVVAAGPARGPGSRGCGACAASAAAPRRALPAAVRRPARAPRRCAHAGDAAVVGERDVDPALGQLAPRPRPARRPGRARPSPQPASVVLTWVSSAARPGPWPRPRSPRRLTSSTCRPRTAAPPRWPRATARSRQRGIGRTRRGTPSTASAGEAAGGRVAVAVAPSGDSERAKLAHTCSRSSSVSLASSSRSSAAIARVLMRAWPTGSP